MTAIIVGSEVLLRGEMTVADLRETIRSVKPRVNTPVSYADVWEFWLRYREVAAEVDFVTAHFLPYWEDVPAARRRRGRACRSTSGKQVAAAFPGKEILIGETGWPSQGTDARRRDCLPHQPGAFHFRDSRAGAAAEFSRQFFRGL